MLYEVGTHWFTNVVVQSAPIIQQESFLSFFSNQLRRTNINMISLVVLLLFPHVGKDYVIDIYSMVFYLVRCDSLNIPTKPVFNIDV